MDSLIETGRLGILTKGVNASKEDYWVQQLDENILTWDGK
jgi:ribosomal protein L14E/L6E/L27E